MMFDRPDFGSFHISGRQDFVSRRSNGWIKRIQVSGIEFGLTFQAENRL